MASSKQERYKVCRVNGTNIQLGIWLRDDSERASSPSSLIRTCISAVESKWMPAPKRVCTHSGTFVYSNMDRRRFISIAGGAGLGILLPYAVYRSLSYGFGGVRVNVKDYEKFGPEAALRAIAPVDQFYVTSSHGEPPVDVNKWSLTIDGLVDEPPTLRLRRHSQAASV